MKEKISSKIVIDRIEDDIAVVVFSDDDSITFNLPVKYLPGGTKEGDHLLMTFDMDKASRESARQKVSGLLKELTGKKD